MALALFGWNYDLVLPLAASATVFAVVAKRRQPSTFGQLAANSLGFWLAGLALCAAYALLFLREPGAGVGQSFTWTMPAVHKAAGLGLGALFASYLPFGLLAVLSSGKPWRSPVVYAGVITEFLVPLFLSLPLLVMASAIFSCALLQVQSCL